MYMTEYFCNPQRDSFAIIIRFLQLFTHFQEEFSKERNLFKPLTADLQYDLQLSSMS